MEILVFGASYCAPCKKNKQLLNDSDIEYTYIDAEENDDLCVRYGIRSVPTTILIQNGSEVDRCVGVVSAGFIERMREL